MSGAAAYEEPLTGMMHDVARELLGKPNDRLSDEQAGLLRFGNYGSIEVNIKEGWFADYEANVRGGVLELLAHKAGLDHAGGFRWLEEKGIKQPTDSEAKRKRIFYEYRSETGEVLFLVERLGKSHNPPFVQHGPDGKGGFWARKGCMRGVRRVPYRLPELLAADPGQIVFVCEGEKDADRLAAKGLVATTNPGGALKFESAFAPMFAGRRVIALQDNDDTGEKHVADVLAKLKGHAAETAALKLPGLPPKGDVSDWLSNGGSEFELIKLAEDAFANASQHDDADEWPALDLVACASEPAPKREWIVEGWIPANKATLLSGDGGVGKSLLAQMKATCVAVGMPFLGLETRHMPAAYLSWEDDADELWRRQEDICGAMGIPMASLSGRLHLISYTEEESPFIVVSSNDARGVEVTALGRKIERLVDRHGVGLLVLDNASQIAGIDHNSTDEVTPFAHFLGRIAKRRNGAVELLHHTNKAGGDYLGSVAYNNGFRSRTLFARPEDAPDLDVREWSNPKANYAQAGGKIACRWFKGAFVRDEDIPPNHAAEIAANIKASAVNLHFHAMLNECLENRRTVSHVKGSNYAPTIFHRMPSGKKYTIRDYEEAMERLLALGEIKLNEPLFQDAHRKWKQGIKSLKICGDPPAATPCGDLRQPHSQTVENACGDLRAAPPPISKDIEGAPYEAGAPSDDEIIWDESEDDD